MAFVWKDTHSNFSKHRNAVLFHSSIPSVISETDTSKQVDGAFCIGLSYQEIYDSLTCMSLQYSGNGCFLSFPTILDRVGF